VREAILKVSAGGVTPFSVTGTGLLTAPFASNVTSHA
jgi:hypothetical protein